MRFITAANGNSTEQNNLPKGIKQKSEKIYSTAKNN